MSKGKVLLTGHHGYIGSVMGPWFIDAGYDVVGLDTVYYDEGCGFSADAGPMAEVHKDIYQLVPNYWEEAQRVLKNGGWTKFVDQNRFARAVREKTGVPIDVTKASHFLSLGEGQ